LSRKCCHSYCFGAIINWKLLSDAWDLYHGEGKSARESALMRDLEKARVEKTGTHTHKIGENYFSIHINGQRVCLTAYAELFMLCRRTVLTLWNHTQHHHLL